ncbi:Cytochrome P450 monooxygenase claM-like protein [Cladobotryum mycophilum]|uniref:Cytochrome P450 monooxygenase claM-like protein n=1 Tax=Cladobotryum mycophilum TaxID=491253 RepID=A0ABR0SW60_9HYPO
MVSIVGTLTSPQNWPASTLVLVVTTIIILFARGLKRSALPPGASWTEKGWPVLGSLKFFTARGDFFREGKNKSSNGHFNFYYGTYPIVALSGLEARQAFYSARGLNLNAGFRALFASGPDIDQIAGRNLSQYFSTLFKRFTTKEHLSRVIPYYFRDLEDDLLSFDVSTVMDPFEKLYPIVYKMTHRTTGSHDVANNPKLVKETLDLFIKIDGSSAIEILFPSLPTPFKLRKLWSGARMHRILSGIVADRKKTGRTEDDAMQMLMDSGDNDLTISAFILGALFAGLINTGIQVAWILCYLAQDPYWYDKAQTEVDGVVAKYRATVDEDPKNILSRLTLEQWESEFPILYAGLLDSIRLNLPGASMRQNTSGKDIPVGNTGVVIPKDAFAVYPLEDAHMNENLYQNPSKWNPGRYLNDRDEGKQEPMGYIGWGAGLHPCLGMRMAKLEITITSALFISNFDFKRCDKKGNPTSTPLPDFDMNALQASRPLGQVFLKCDRRF